MDEPLLIQTRDSPATMALQDVEAIHIFRLRIRRFAFGNGAQAARFG